MLIIKEILIRLECTLTDSQEADYYLVNEHFESPRAYRIGLVDRHKQMQLYLKAMRLDKSELEKRTRVLVRQIKSC